MFVLGDTLTGANALLPFCHAALDVSRAVDWRALDVGLG
jgi:hypothetical protein